MGHRVPEGAVSAQLQSLRLHSLDGTAGLFDVLAAPPHLRELRTQRPPDVDLLEAAHRRRGVPLSSGFPSAVEAPSEADGVCGAADGRPSLSQPSEPASLSRAPLGVLRARTRSNVASDQQDRWWCLRSRAASGRLNLIMNLR